MTQSLKKTGGTSKSAKQPVSPMILVLGSMIIGAAIYALGTQPALVRAQEAETTRQGLEADVLRQQTISGQLPQLRNNNQRLEAQMATAQAQFPRQEQLSSLISEIETSARAAGVTTGSYQRKIEQSEIGGVDRVTLNTTFEGDYKEIMAMLRSIADRRRFITVETIDMRTQEDSNVTASTTFGAYMLREAPAPEPSVNTSDPSYSENAAPEGGN